MPVYTIISSQAFRYPPDRQAEQALRNLPRFDLIARKFVEFIYERLDETEIRAMLAHELEHIKCGHTILIQMAMWAMSAVSGT